MAGVLEFLLDLHAKDNKESMEVVRSPTNRSKFIGVLTFNHRINQDIHAFDTISAITLENIHSETLFGIIQILSQITSLECIYIKGTVLLKNHIEYLAKGLLKSKELLYKIFIIDSELRDTELEILCGSLKEMKKLQYLELSGNYMDTLKASKCVANLFRELKKYNCLKDLALKNNRISDTSFRNISKQLQGIKTLSKLNFGNNMLKVNFYFNFKQLILN